MPSISFPPLPARAWERFNYIIAALANMGVVLYRRHEYKPSLQAFLEALVTLEKMGAIPDARTVAGWVTRLRQELGGEKFDPLWSEITNRAPLPDWLA